MRVIDLAWKDLRQLARDWKVAVFLVGMPIVFTLMIGFALGGFGGESDPRLPVAFVDRDGGAASAGLSKLLSGSEVVRLVAMPDAADDDLEQKVREGELAAAAIVPAGYSGEILSERLVSLVVIVDDASSAGRTVQGEIQAAVNRLAGAAEAARLSAQLYAERAGFADKDARQAFLEEALDRAIGAWSAPPLTIRATQSEVLAAQKEEANLAGRGFSHSSPSMMVQFAMSGVMGAGEILVLERRSKALRRLLTTAISRAEIIVGHYLAVLVMVLAQLVLLVSFGHFLLGVPYLREPVAVVLLMVPTALWISALGLLVGTLARTLEQVIIFSMIPMFLLAGLGGAWVPLEFAGETFRAIGHLLPTAWAMDGFKNIVVRGLGLPSALLPAGVMLAYAVVILAAALWRFRFE